MGNAYAASPGNDLPQDDYLANACSDGRYYRWTRMPIRVAIASASGVPGYRDAFPQVLRDAFAKWAAASENRISFVFVQSPSQADICCDWTNNPNKVAEGGRAVEGGLTKLSGQPQSNRDVSINSARITILTNRNGQSLNDDDMKKVCLHEVGHALGINGHSNNNTDIMFFSESPTVWPSLTKRDKATICRLYANYPRQASGRN
jgi:predicted Zn-dependent protease